MKYQVSSQGNHLRRSAANQRGFSLMEMLVGCAIVAFMGMTAIPQIARATAEYRLAAVAREVKSNLSNARVRSITQNADHRVVVSSPDSYLIQEEVAGTWTNRESFMLPAGFTIGADGATVQFHRRGNAAPVATFDITNENSTVVQVVTSTSGRTNVQ